MLVIEYRDEQSNTMRRVNWHYSQPLPEWALRSRVLKITADGDELGLLLDAIQATIKKIAIIDVTPGAAPQLTRGDTK